TGSGDGACRRAIPCAGSSSQTAATVQACPTAVDVPHLRAIKRCFEQTLELRPPNLDRTETCEMAGEELRVEQIEAAVFEAGYEIDERDLARIAGLGEHAFAEERPAEMHAVKASDHLAVVPDLDPKAMPYGE